MIEPRQMNRYSRIVDQSLKRDCAKAMIDREFEIIKENVDLMMSRATTKEEQIKIQEYKVYSEKRALQSFESIMFKPVPTLIDYFESRGSHLDEECQRKCNFICEYDRCMYDQKSLMKNRPMGRADYVQED